MNLCFIQLRRYGDIMNILPVCKGLYDQGHTIQMAIHEDFIGIITGLNYISPISIDSNVNLSKAEQIIKYRFPKSQIIVSQVDGNPLTARFVKNNNFTLAQWHCTFYQLEKLKIYSKFDYYTSKLIFDNRNYERENKLLEKVNLNQNLNSNLDLNLNNNDFDILVNLKSHSSPFKFKEQLTLGLKRDFKIIDLSEIRAEQIYDLLAFYDRAKILVSVDTCTLHLANCLGNRSNHIPVIALSRPERWSASESRNFWVKRFYYGDFKYEFIKKAIEEVLKNNL